MNLKAILRGVVHGKKIVLCLLVGCIWLGGFYDGNAQAILSPPFGLKWGDSPDKILDWAESKKLDVTIKIPGARPEIREILVSASKGPLPGHQAYGLEVRYHWGKLYEVTVHYGAPGVRPADAKVAFDQLKRMMIRKHGEFKPNKKVKEVKSGVKKKSESYHIEPVAGLLLLMAYTELDDTLRKHQTARFSLLYRNQNILPKK